MALMSPTRPASSVAISWIACWRVTTTSSGQQSFLDIALQDPRFELVRADVLDDTALCAAMSG
jgi:hypothetical protein